MRRRFPFRMTPLPQESLGSGRKSGSNPYLEGPKNAACVLTRKIAAISRCRFFQASPAIAKAITPISNYFVPILTVRLLYRSARNPPVMENRMKGTEKRASATRTSRSRSTFSIAVPRMMKAMRFLYALSFESTLKLGCHKRPKLSSPRSGDQEFRRILCESTWRILQPGRGSIFGHRKS